MQIRKALVAAAVAGPLLLATSPMSANTPILLQALVSNEGVIEGIKLGQVALCDGSVRLEPGEYSLKIVSTGPGAVRASFFDKSGRKAGEAKGIIAVLKQSQAGALAAPQGQGKSAFAGGTSKPGESPSLTFSKLGFGPNSRASFSQAGQKLELQILSKDETHVILIGLLLPAVQKVREAPVKP